MTESLENSFSQNTEEFKYPIDFTKQQEIAEIELGLSNKEIRKIFEVCEECYGDTVKYIKECAKKEGFKKVIFSSFGKNFHVFPVEKSNSYFMPVKFIPRLNNLMKIMPEIGEVGIRDNVAHERQHCLSSALEGHKKRFAIGEYEKKINTPVKFIESQTNLQRIIKETRNNNLNVEKVVLSISKYYLYITILSEGAEVLESDYIEKEAVEWFESSYSFIRDDYKDLFVKEFNTYKDEIIKKYNKYIEENQIDDFYNDEDRECEELRIKVINRLNEMAQ